MRKIGIIGCGVVGSSWATIFARSGLDVKIFDADTGSLPAAQEQITARVSAIENPGKIEIGTSLADIIDWADYIQESAPERLDLKRTLYAEIDGLMTTSQVVGSSTSGLPASSFTEGMRHRDQCLVVHPINPPHIIPLVELVPAPWTSPQSIDRAASLMSEIGQSPIRLSREINGFVVNRLQSALLGEAFRLVQDGICPVDDVDKAIRDGLGLRWFFMGPFETIDLNARDGIAQYCQNLGPMYFELAKEQADPRAWNDQLVADVEKQRIQFLPREELKARQEWRDQMLASLVSAKARLIPS